MALVAFGGNRAEAGMGGGALPTSHSIFPGDPGKLEKMGDRRGSLVVIAAGYRAEGEGLLAANRGLRDRFANTFHFENHGVDERVSPFDSFAAEPGFTLGPEARTWVRDAIGRSGVVRHPAIANGRWVRNRLDEAKERLARRVLAAAARGAHTLSTLEPDDPVDIGSSGAEAPP